jgi:hypothetical protein
MSPRSFSAFLNEVKSDETFARDLRSALVSVNKNEISAIVDVFARRKGMEVDAESLQASMNIVSAPEFSDREIEYILHGATGMESNLVTCQGYTCGREVECRYTSYHTCD